MHIRRIALGCLLLSAPAMAQTPEAVAAPAEATAGEAQAAPAPTADEKADLLKGRLDSLEEQYSETKTSVLKLEKLKFSGYVQARYQHAENSASALKSDGSPAITDGFSVRRGRLKATYSATHSSYVIQIDATPKGVALKDAEATFIEPWTGHKLSLTLGQTKWPFGYEAVQSSGDREFPERTRVVRAFSPGERDRGAKLSLKEGIFRATVGVFDGNGTENKPFPGVDNDEEKDIVGRISVDLKWLTAGVSGWWGNSFAPFDANLPDDTGKHFPRNRVGADVQAYLDLLPIGSTAIKGEFIAGKTYMSSGAERYGQPALGWYALLVQNLGLSDQVGVRYDYFDGYAGIPNAADSNDPTKPGSRNGVGTLGLLVTHYLDDAIKLSAVYELPMTDKGGSEVKDPKDNLFTLQLQAKF
jgi:Phosphate-selective porin O and P